MSVNLDDGCWLMCPHPGCGSTNLHHDEVAVFERAEDQEKGLRVRVLGVDVIWKGERPPKHRPASVVVEEALTGNPSSRRQGVRVHLWCEICRKRSELTISQHKGCTYLACQPLEKTST